MTTEQTDRPVIVRYMTDVEPTAEHPSGHRMGQSYEAASVAVAEEWHPEAVIVKFADSGAYPEPE